MDAPAKQQIVERVKQAENILVTVSKDPTVDQLAACIGLTLLLNKMGKHATAVFSGKIPSTLEFLQPEKTLETNTDSLRDFIISLDKEKADKLRYKVEDQVVRIFITPYRTSLSEKDLVFSQGDFNVEAVVALGIKDRTQIDAAITAHGRILHDATVISLNIGQGIAPEVGQINWQEPASSLCEMLVSISEAFGSGLIDNQMATAFLTGIVAETERFSNPKTSPKVMTISAQLMAAGANQQLIATKLQPPPPPPPPPAAKPKKEAPQPKSPEPTAKPDAQLEAKLLSKPDGSLNVAHGDNAPKESQEVEVSPNEIRIDEEGNIQTTKDVGPSKPQGEKPPEPELPKVEPAKTSVEDTKPFSPEPLPPPPPPTLPAATPLPAPTLPANEPPKQPEPPKANARMPASRPTIPTPPVTDEYKPHELMDPLNRPPAFGAAFSADTNQPTWADSYNSVPFDPLNGGGLKSDGFRGATVKNVEPPEGQAAGGELDVDKIRSQVENVYNTSPSGYQPPQQNTGAAFLEPGLHTPPPSPTGPQPTPSFNLPTNGAPQSPPPFPPPPTIPPLPPNPTQ